MRRIKRNAARCKLCGDIIESAFRHHFVTCSCGNLSVDGGTDYIRRGFANGQDSYEDMNEYGYDVMSYHAVGPGWWKLLDKELKDFYDIDPGITRIDVKEKYGRADVFVHTDSDNRHDLISMHEEVLTKASMQTCELCGAHGEIRNDRGWIQCRCDRCHAATREERSAIMRQTSEEYHNTIDHILESVAGSMALSDMELTERDKAYIRYAIWFPDEVEATVQRIIQSHRAT